ncbi:MAG: PTS sugar transporter subunit IIB [Desulfonauticus sp.]|nr:PTS sugar transporter subunit IIB [Desulfonauticus sp.]
MMWVRIDNRLIHGQVIETWIPYVEAKWILVMNDELAKDSFQQEIMCLAVPDTIKIYFLSVYNPLAYPKDVNLEQTLVLLANCNDAKTVFDQGFTFDVLNIGNLHYAPGKEQICDHIALSKEDIDCLHYFEYKGVNLDFRCVPNSYVQVSI